MLHDTAGQQHWCQDSVQWAEDSLDSCRYLHTQYDLRGISCSDVYIDDGWGIMKLACKHGKPCPT
jgi:hypothetical protein